MNETQIKILQFLAEDNEMCWYSRKIAKEVGLLGSTVAIRPHMRALLKAGYIELVRGLISDDGPGYRGSGYRILPIGERLLKELLPTNK